MIRAAFVALILAVVANAAEPFDFGTLSEDEIAATVTHMAALNKELQGKLDTEKAAHAVAKESIASLQIEIGNVTKTANDALDNLDAANAKLAAAEKHVSRLKTICCSAGAAVALLLLIMVGLPKFGIYGIAGTVLIAGGVYGLLWKIL